MSDLILRTLLFCMGIVAFYALLAIAVSTTAKLRQALRYYRRFRYPWRTAWALAEQDSRLFHKTQRLN